MIAFNSNHEHIQPLRDGGLGDADFEVAKATVMYKADSKFNVNGTKTFDAKDVYYRKDNGEPIAIHGLRYNPVQYSEMINKTGLEETNKILASYPHMLSGGQRQRVMIAISLVCSPEILIADEPTTALDVTLQLQILDLLKKFKEKTSMSLILISHDLDLIKNYSDRVIIMKDGNILEDGETKKIFKNPTSNGKQLIG